MAKQFHRIDLKKPLLIITTDNGMLACGYVNPATADKTGEACAIVTGVNDFEAMETALVVAVSAAAEALGVKVGDTGAAALEKMG
jgi:uncharacterized protein YunC (DUF1805 family)